MLPGTTRIPVYGPFLAAMIGLHMCSVMSASQQLYVVQPIDLSKIPNGTSTLDYYFDLILNPKIGERALGDLFESNHVDGFKAVHIEDVKAGTGTNIHDAIVEFSILFIKDISLRIRQSVALILLKEEERGFIIIGNKTLYFKKPIAIFNSKEDVANGVDAIDWCSSPDLFSCPSHSTCNDTGIWYTCPCLIGYYTEGSECKSTVRLVNGSHKYEGRLEFYSNGEWYTVCDEGFESTEASVVCRQLGYPSRGAQVNTDTLYGQGNTDIYTYDLECSGTETLLSVCSKGRQHYNCSHLQDVGVICEAECLDNYHYGTNCSKLCDCPVNSTESCDRNKGTCFCRAGWEGVTCTQDVNECILGTDDCTDVHEMCENTAGGFQCTCAPHAKRNSSGICVGVVSLTGPIPFSTDGSRDLTLTCSPGNIHQTINITWNVTCDRKDNDTCTFKPMPQNDGKVVTCVVIYSDGQSTSASITLDLNYPPLKPPVIHGYSHGEVLQAGNNLVMQCTIKGGKPLVTSVDFSCLDHPDQEHDIVDVSEVKSGLTLDHLRSTDNEIFCVCTGVWKDANLYSLSATIQLLVNGTEIEDDNGIALNAGVACGVTLLVVIIIAIVIWRIYRRYTYNLHNREPNQYISEHGFDYSYFNSDIYHEISDTTHGDGI